MLEYCMLYLIMLECTVYVANVVMHLLLLLSAVVQVLI